MSDEILHLTDELLNEYLDGMLENEGSDALEAHLASCQDCQRRLTSFKGVFAALRDLSDTPLEHDLTPGILAVIAPKKAGWRPLPTTLKALFGAQLLVASLLLAFDWPFGMNRLLPWGYFQRSMQWASITLGTLNTGWLMGWQTFRAYMQSSLERGVSAMNQISWLTSGFQITFVDVLIILGAALILWLVSNGLLVHPIMKE
jgi:anti-sigma factor RsiW